jgi:flagellar biosynthesis/type III secretory pathway protein FliH
MPIGQLAVSHSTRARNPRDITGREYARQNAEQQAKKAEANLDINEVRRQASAAGYEKGSREGFIDGWNALGNLLIESGAITEERLLEIVNSTDETVA